MTKRIHWLSIAAIASVLLLVPIASTPVAFTDGEGGIKQCVDDCIEVFDDAMENCDELEVGGPYENCVLDALRVLNNCILGGGGGEEAPFALPPPRLGCGEGPGREA